MRAAVIAFAAIVILLIVGAEGARAQPLTAGAFTRDPAILEASLSPNGQYVAVVRQNDEGQTLVIFDWRAGRAQAIESAARDRFLSFEWVAWKNDNRLLFALHQRAFWYGVPNRDSNGDVERIFAVNRDGTNMTQMFEGQLRRLAADWAPSQLVDIAPRDPDHVLISTWGAYGYSLFRVNVANGQAAETDRMAWETRLVFVDGAGNPVMRADALPYNSGTRFLRRAPGGGRWVLATEVRRSTLSQNRDFRPLGAGPGPGQIYVAARPEGQEFQSIYLYDTATGELGAPIFQYDHADAQVASLDRNDNSLLIGCGETQRWQCRALDPRLQRHVSAVSAYFEGLADFFVTDVSVDRKVWLVYANGPTIPGTFYVYDLEAAHITPVGSEHPQIPRAQLAPVEVVRYAGRDGAPLWGYLMTPAGGAGARPLVVWPHGGPEIRDSFSYDYFAQFLASRGYSVFQPNFRGSEGSGRSFVDAGHEQWGMRMQDDITDGVRALIAAGRVDASRVCIVGASYGGYAALAGATLTPDLYKCAVSISGVSDLPEVLNSERQDGGRQSLSYAYWSTLIGDPGRLHDQLIATSPARQAAAVRAPIMLIHGSDDWTVPIRQSELMRDALERAHKRVEYIRLEDEDHYWSNWKPEDRESMFNDVARFVDQNIGAAPAP